MNEKQIVGKPICMRTVSNDAIGVLRLLGVNPEWDVAGDMIIQISDYDVERLTALISELDAVRLECVEEKRR